MPPLVRERERESCIRMRSLFGNVMVWMWLCVDIGALASEVLSLKALAAAEKYKVTLKDPTLNPEEFKDEDLFEIVYLVW